MNEEMNNGFFTSRQETTFEAQQGMAPEPQAFEPQGKRTFERWLGGKAFGVIAAVLVLAGLGMLGAVIIPQLGEGLKAALVFAFSVVLMVSGVLLSYRKLNAFTVALQVCGAGALVIAVLLARYHFLVIGDTTAFVLLVVWGSLCWGAFSITRAFSLSIAAMVFMLPFGFGLMGSLAPHPAWGMAAGLLTIAQFAVAMAVVIDERARAAQSAGIAMQSGRPNDVGSARAAAKPLRVDVHNARIALLVACELALACLAGVSHFSYRGQVATIVYAAALLGLAMLPIARANVRYYLPFRVNEIVVLLVLAFVMSLARPELLGSALYAVALALVVGLAVFRMRELPRAAAGSMVRKGTLMVFGAVAFTFCLTGYLYGCTYLVVEPYVYSTVLIACALAAIVVGFRFQAAPLRLYGLVLTLLCALKLVTVDTSGFDEVSRVCAFVISGLMCFVVSALYNYASKRLQA